MCYGVRECLYLKERFYTSRQSLETFFFLVFSFQILVFSYAIVSISEVGKYYSIIYYMTIKFPKVSCKSQIREL